jgi:membrane-associated protease RseP (regulator of RpoE activity)
MRYMKFSVVALILAGSIGSVTSSAFPGEEKWLIVRTSGDSLTKCSLDSLAGTKLLFHQNASQDSVDLDSVSVLQLPNEARPLLGMFIGALAGGAVGYLVAPGSSVEHHHVTVFIDWVWDEEIPSRKPGATAGGVVLGGLLGYYIGSQIGAERVYDLRYASVPEKDVIVRSLLRSGGSEARMNGRAPSQTQSAVSRFGFAFDGNGTVQSCAKHLPAANAGMLAGDKMIKVNGDPVGGEDIMTLLKKIDGDAGNKVTIQVLRGGAEYLITLEIK